MHTCSGNSTCDRLPWRRVHTLTSRWMYGGSKLCRYCSDRAPSSASLTRRSFDKRCGWRRRRKSRRESEANTHNDARTHLRMCLCVCVRVRVCASMCVHAYVRACVFVCRAQAANQAAPVSLQGFETSCRAHTAQRRAQRLGTGWTVRSSGRCWDAPAPDTACSPPCTSPPAGGAITQRTVMLDYAAMPTSVNTNSGRTTVASRSTLCAYCLMATW